MPIYYVSPSGNDANNGLGPDASHATNKPWLTLGKLFGASGLASGDLAYIGPGVYRGQVQLLMSSPSAETIVEGDPRNIRGFKNASGILLPPGEVRLTPYETNDTTTPVGTATTLDLNGRSFLTFRNLWILGGNSSPSCFRATVSHSTNIKLTDCVFTQGYTPQGTALLSYNSVGGIPANWVIDRCTFQGISTRSLSLQLLRSSSADYSAGIQIQNSVFLGGGTGVYIFSSGAGTFKGGGISMINCSFLFQAAFAVSLPDSNLSTTFPSTVKNCLIVSGGTGLQSNVAGQLVEDWNLNASGTAQVAAVANGANTKRAGEFSCNFEVGQARIWGQRTRAYFTPTVGSPLLGFGQDGSAPTVDTFNRPRPSGGTSTLYAVGAMERHNQARSETAVTDSGGIGLAIAGPGDHDFDIPVNATPTSITVKARYDTNHGTTNKPQAILLDASEIGVATQTLTMTSGAGVWQTLSFAPFTPTATGWVTVRLVSRASAGSGIAYFDTFTVN